MVLAGYPFQRYRERKGYMKTKFQDLNLSNYFLFAAAAEDEETSRLLVETLLGIEVGRVKVHIEHSILYNSDFRSLRLDIFMSDEVEVRYNMEMENEGREALPQRSRFHQAEMDVMSLGPGQSMSELKPVYVVFICTFDPFGRGRYRYTFENRCVEEDFPLEDGATRVFLSTKGKNHAEVPEELVNLLYYIEDSTESCVSRTNDAVVRKLHERVQELKRSRTWEGRYMMFEELLLEHERKGIKQGLEQGREEGLEQGLEKGREQGLEQGREEATARILRLIKEMTIAGEADQILRLEQEPEFLAAMIEKYHL